ncbi:uncharacterized protein LOC124498093 [Dermatophagoides farinae]|uniref:uncharacterized protein LOC124498093 n=1 Tax=Dermatophagoides farinae TaxID=6954 RepID=UPI003F62CA9D
MYRRSSSRVPSLSSLSSNNKSKSTNGGGGGGGNINTSSKSNRNNCNEKFTMEKICMGIDMKLDQIDMIAFDTNDLAKLMDLKFELQIQKSEQEKLARMITKKTNIERSLFEYVRNLAKKIKEYEIKIDRKCANLNLNGSATTQTKLNAPQPSNDDVSSSEMAKNIYPLVNDENLANNFSRESLSSSPPSPSSSSSPPPPPSSSSPPPPPRTGSFLSQKSEQTKYSENDNHHHHHHYVDSRPYRRINIFTDQKKSVPIESSNPNKLTSALDILKKTKNHKLSMVFDDPITNDGIEHGNDVRLAYGGDFIFDDDPDPTIVPQPVANLEKDWKQNMKNFLMQYHDYPTHRLIRKFNQSRAPFLKQLSLNDRIEIFNSMLNELVENYHDEHDKLIVPFIRMAEEIFIPSHKLHIMEWANEKIKNGLYHDIINYYQELQHQIDNCEDETLKSLWINELESKKMISLKRFRGTLILIGTAYNKCIYNTKIKIIDIALHLFGQSKFRQLHLELFTDFILMVGQKLLSNYHLSSSSSTTNNPCTLDQLNEIWMKFKSSNDDWPDYLEDRRKLAINLFENHLQLYRCNDNFKNGRSYY